MKQLYKNKNTDIKMFNALQFLKDHDIKYWTSGKNVSSGWVNIQCPMCYDSSNHGGFKIKGNSRYSCWNCGHHWLDAIISNLLNCTRKEANKIIKKYSTDDIGFEEKEKAKIIKTGKLELPTGIAGITKKHIKYLEDRNFNFNHLIKDWGITGTGHLGNYKFRIMIPIYFNGKMISYLGRDITGKQSIRYKACKIENELLHHKYICYGIDHIKNRKAVIVEGCTDAWRLGYGAVATFGTEWTMQQVHLLNKKADEFFIMYDPEDTAQEKAEKLAWQLSSLGNSAILIEYKDISDPAELSEADAKWLMKELTG